MSPVNTLSINSDNHLFVSGHDDGIINVWNLFLDQYQPTNIPLKVHNDSVLSLYLSKDGK